MWANILREKSKVCQRLFFEECQQRPNYYLDLRGTLCYVHDEDNLYPVIMNSHTNFIHNISFFHPLKGSLKVGKTLMVHTWINCDSIFTLNLINKCIPKLIFIAMFLVMPFITSSPTCIQIFKVLKINIRLWI